MRVIINILLFQAGWFACVLGAAAGQPLLGTVVALAVVAVHLVRSAHPGRESALVLCAAVVGIAADTALIQFGLLSFANGVLVAGATPHWMVALWMIFATTLNVSLSWLRERPFLAATAGALGGPLAYYAGTKLGALQLSSSLGSFVAIALVWALALPLLTFVAARLQRAGVTAARRYA